MRGTTPYGKNMRQGTRFRHAAFSVERAVRDLNRELRTLRSGLISLLGEDPEGSYRPEFVAEILEAADETAAEEFTDPKRFRARRVALR